MGREEAIERDEWKMWWEGQRYQLEQQLVFQLYRVNWIYCETSHGKQLESL